MGGGYSHGILRFYDVITDEILSIPLGFTAESAIQCDWRRFSNIMYDTITIESEPQRDNELVESESLNEFLDNFKIKE